MFDEKYDELDFLKEIDEALEIVEAPEGFAEAVMAKVAALDLYTPKVARSKEKLIDGLIFFGWFLAAAGIVAVVLLTDVVSRVAGFFANVGEGANGAAMLYGAMFLVIFVGLVILQVFLAPNRMRVKQKIEMGE